MKIIFLVLAVLMLKLNSLHKGGNRLRQKRIQINKNKVGIIGSRRLAKDVTVKQVTIKKPAEYLEKQKAESAAGEAIYKSNKSGRYALTDLPVASGRMFMRVQQKGVENDNMSVFQDLQFKINDKMLYFLNDDDDYRGIVYGLDLSTVPTERDAIERGQCCYRIEPQIRQVKIDLYSFQGYCFRIDMPSENWLFCNEDQVQTQTFKETLRQQIINAWYVENRPGQQPVFSLASTDCSCINFSWEPIIQRQWPCQCSKPTSMNQSPINIDPDNEEYIELLEDAVVAMKTPTVFSAQFSLKVMEPEVYAQFGKIIFKHQEEQIIYEINKVTFKIGQEHQIVGQTQQIVGEMHVHGMSESGDYGILVIQLAKGAANKFIDSLYVDQWPKSYDNIKDSPDMCNKKRVCIKSSDITQSLKFHLNDVISTLMFDKDDKGKQKIDYSFFKYKGSLTKPPCTENVDWYIMKVPASISSSQLEFLKTAYLVKMGLKTKTNVREIQQLNDRKVFYAQCASVPKECPCNLEECKKLPQCMIGVVAPEKVKFMHAYYTQKIHAMTQKYSDGSSPTDDVFNAYANKNTNAIIFDNDSNLILTKLKHDKGKKPDEIDTDTMNLLIKKFHQANPDTQQ